MENHATAGKAKTTEEGASVAKPTPAKSEAIDKTSSRSNGSSGRPGGKGGRPPKKFLGKTSEKIGFVLGIVRLLAIWIAPPVWGLPPEGMHMLGILALCLVWWIFTPHSRRDDWLATHDFASSHQDR